MQNFFFAGGGGGGGGRGGKLGVLFHMVYVEMASWVKSL